MRYIKRRKPSTEGFVVVRDDREKRPWRLPFEVEVKRLSVGDYSIKGYEDFIAIEKKSGMAELLTDLSAGYRDTFKRFLVKMSKHPIRCIIVEGDFSQASIEYQLAIMRKKSAGRLKLTSKTVTYWIAQIMLEYGIPILFVRNGHLGDVLPEVFQAAYEKAKYLRGRR